MVGGSGTKESATGTNPATADVKVSVTAYSRSGEKFDAITNALKTIKDDILSGDNSCSRWLSGGLATVTEYVDILLNAGNYGVAAIGNGEIAAFVGNNIQDQTPIDGLPSDASITVGAFVAFFNKGFVEGPKGYQGGSIQAQTFIFIHELAHSLQIPGFLADAGIPENGKSNNALIQANCGKQISALGKKKK